MIRIPLIEFEDFIEPAILRRGKSYFDKGCVEHCEEITPGIFEAVVAGTEDYFLQLLIADGIVSRFVCDCPYDDGPVCKHIAAVLFHLRQNEFEPPKAIRTSTDLPKKAKRKTAADLVNELLDKVSHDELRQFIREKAQEDRSFRGLLLSSFAHLGEGESKAFYVSQIKAILRAAKGRHGYIHWGAAGRAGAEVSRLIDVAEKYIAAQNYSSALHIAPAVMEQMTEALQYSDDSDGAFGENINYALGLLYKTAKTDLPEEIRSQLLDYCLKAFDKKTYEGWDWHFDMLDLASELIKTEQEAWLIFDLLEKGVRTDRERESAECMNYELLKKIKGKKVADDYLAGHISNYKLRQIAIEKALKEKQYDKARVLAEDGIKQHRGKLPGLVNEWYEWLLKIAQAEKNTEDIINYARLLFIDGHHHEHDHYALMQRHVPPEQWDEFVEKLIRDLSAGRRWSEPAIAGIYIKEGMWERLFELVKDSPTLSKLDSYEKYLKKDYASELADMYGEAVIQYLSEGNNMGRKHYQNACRYIRRIKKIGSPQRAECVIAALREKYPQRKALLEELEMV